MVKRRDSITDGLSKESVLDSGSEIDRKAAFGVVALARTLSHYFFTFKITDVRME